MNLLNQETNENGITLISLIITVVVILILAGVALTFTVYNENLMTKTEDTKSIWDNKVEEGNLYINNAEIILNQYVK